MVRQNKLAAVIDRYRKHPEFLGMDIVDVNQPGAVDDRLMHIAARKGAVEDIEVLVRAGASVNIPGDMGYTPLHAAAMGGSIESVRKLLRLGADPMTRNELGETPATIAELLGHTKIGALLRRSMKNADIGNRKTKRKAAR